MRRRPAGRLPLLLVHAVLVQLMSYALRPAISSEILDQGYAASWLGVATAAFAVPPLVLAVPAGRLVDRIGERTMIVCGGASFVVAAALAVLAGDALPGLLAATVFLGLGVLCSVVGEQAWVMRDARSGRLDAAFGLYTFATSTGQMLGPLLLLLPPDGRSPAPPFAEIAWIVLAAAVVCLVLSFGIPSRQQPAGAGEAVRPRGATREILRRPGAWSALVTSSLVLASLDIVLAYLPLLVRERGFAAAWLSAMLVARGAATMASRISLGILTRRFGRRRVLVAGGIVSAASLLTLVLPLHPLLATAAMAAYGLAAGIVQPLTMSWMTLITPIRQRGVAASLRLVGNRVGQTVLPLAVAGLSVVGGAALVFGATAASLVVSAWVSRTAPDGDEEAGAAELD